MEASDLVSASNGLEYLPAFLTSLAIGLFVGLERERSPAAKAGLRTFALIALSGTLFAMLGEKTGASWLLGAIAVVIGAMLVAAYATGRSSEEDDPGTTTVISALITFGLGAASKVQQVEIRWPSGQVDRLGAQDAGQTRVVTEAKGVTQRVPLGR